MSKKPIFKGHIDLALLTGAEIKDVDGNESLVVPVRMNPFLMLSKNENDSVKALLPVSISECDSNPFSSHYIRVGTDKKKRKELGLTSQELGKYSPVIGNLRSEREVEIKNLVNNIIEQLDEIRDEEGDFDTDYVKDMIEQDEFDIWGFLNDVDHLCSKLH